MISIFLKIIYKVINTYFKVKIKEYFDNYLIDSDNILITTKINKNYIVINIYNTELMFPSINNINIIKCDIYNIKIKIPLKIKSVKIKITGINLSYEIFDKILEKSNIFRTSLNKEINNINNEFIDLLEYTIKEETKGILIIEKWINSIIDSCRIKFSDIIINDITNNIRVKIDNIYIKTNLDKIKIKKISIWNDVNKFIEIKNIIINENFQKYKIYKIKIYLDIKYNLTSILSLFKKYKKILSIYQNNDENNINIHFECFMIVIKYSVNNLNNIYLNLSYILLNENILSVNDITIYFIVYLRIIIIV